MINERPIVKFFNYTIYGINDSRIMEGGMYGY